ETGQGRGCHPDLLGASSADTGPFTSLGAVAAKAVPKQCAAGLQESKLAATNHTTRLTHVCPSPRSLWRHGLGVARQKESRAQTRATCTTPFTLLSAFITDLSWVSVLQWKVNMLWARPSSAVRQLASVMLMCCSLKVWLTVARMPGLLLVVTLSCTGRSILALVSQLTSMRRSGSVSKALMHSRRWMVTPRPRVMKPMMLSPGNGLQHLA